MAETQPPAAPAAAPPSAPAAPDKPKMVSPSSGFRAPGAGAPPAPGASVADALGGDQAAAAPAGLEDELRAHHAAARAPDPRPPAESEIPMPGPTTLAELIALRDEQEAIPEDGPDGSGGDQDEDGFAADPPSAGDPGGFDPPRSSELSRSSDPQSGSGSADPSGEDGGGDDDDDPDSDLDQESASDPDYEVPDAVDLFGGVPGGSEPAGSDGSPAGSEPVAPSGGPGVDAADPAALEALAAAAATDVPQALKADTESILKVSETPVAAPAPKVRSAEPTRGRLRLTLQDLLGYRHGDADFDEDLEKDLQAELSRAGLNIRDFQLRRLDAYRSDERDAAIAQMQDAFHGVVSNFERLVQAASTRVFHRQDQTKRISATLLTLAAGLQLHYSKLKDNLESLHGEQTQWAERLSEAVASLSKHQESVMKEEHGRLEADVTAVRSAATDTVRFIADMQNRSRDVVRAADRVIEQYESFSTSLGKKLALWAIMSAFAGAAFGALLAALVVFTAGASG